MPKVFNFPIWLSREVLEGAFNAFRAVTEHTQCGIAHLTQDASNRPCAMIVVYMKRLAIGSLLAYSAFTTLVSKQFPVTRIARNGKQSFQTAISSLNLLTLLTVERQSLVIRLVEMKGTSRFYLTTSVARLLSCYFRVNASGKPAPKSLGIRTGVVILALPTIGLVVTGATVGRLGTEVIRGLDALTTRTLYVYDWFGHAVSSLIGNGLARPDHSFARVVGPLCILT